MKLDRRSFFAALCAPFVAQFVPKAEPVSLAPYPPPSLALLLDEFYSRYMGNAMRHARNMLHQSTLALYLNPKPRGSYAEYERRHQDLIPV
ncbi:MAG TPA: hypothetical protein VKX49_12725 [Bryobacteraceae bacterium]|nr:hypothetical protein [Bryobacteraceae bacterium]